MHVVLETVLEALQVLVTIAYLCCEAAVRLVVPHRAKCIRDQVVLITGGAQGIGQHTAKLVADRGATLVLWDIDETRLQTAADDLRKTGTQVFSYKCDVSCYADVTRVAEKVQQDVGNVDVLINNAGILKCKALTDLSEQDIQQTMGVNTMAHFWTLKAFLPAMMSQNKGHIVTISSMAGHGGSPLTADYTASKFAARGLTDAVQRECRQKGLGGIKFTTVYPLFTNTALVHKISHRSCIKMRFGRILEPQEVATAIVDGFLRNKREVYIPSHGALLPLLLGTLPWKANQVVADFIDTRFYSIE